MFDLIGFWVALTVAIVPQFLVFNCLFVSILAAYLDNITGGEFNNNKLNKICPSVLWMEYIQGIYGTKESLNVITIVFSHVAGFILLILSIVAQYQGVLLQKYFLYAEYTASFFSWVFIVVGGYLASVYAGKFIYRFGKRVSKLSQAFDKHISDKDAHK